MATLAVKETAWTSATAQQKNALRMVCQRLDLGQPARYQTAGNVVWLVFDDNRIDLTDVAILARAAVTLATMPNVNTRQELYDAVKANIVLPQNITYTTNNPWSETLVANSAPNWLQAAGEVPNTLTPVVI
jgi:hypothetical protein